MFKNFSSEYSTNFYAELSIVLMFVATCTWGHTDIISFFTFPLFGTSVVGKWESIASGNTGGRGKKTRVLEKCPWRESNDSTVVVCIAHSGC